MGVSYYHAPLGQVISIGTPAYLRQGKELPEDLCHDFKKKSNILDVEYHPYKRTKKCN